MSILGGEFSLRGVVPSWAKAGVPRKGWSPPKKGSVHPQMAVINFKDLCEKDNFYFDSTTLHCRKAGGPITKMSGNSSFWRGNNTDKCTNQFLAKF